MLRKSLLSLALVVVPVFSAAALPVVAEPAGQVELARAQVAVFGPYATMRRANEVANYARSLGYSAVAFHNGNGYYVRVW